MRNILQVLQIEGRGGVQELVWNLACKLSEKGYSVSIFTFLGASKEYINLYENVGIKVCISPYKPNDIRNIRLLREYIKENNIDLVHVHNTYPQILCSILIWGRLSRVKLLVTEHSTTSARRRFKLLRFLDELTYVPYTKIICVSESVEQSAKGWLKHISDDKFVIVENGIEIDRFRKAEPVPRKDLRFKDSDFVIISVGRLVPGKGFCTILDAMELLPDSYKLVIIGSGPQHDELEERINMKGLKERVVMTGSIRNVENYLKSGDLYVSASHTEGFGLTIIEASAAGLPVLATRIPAYQALLPQNQLFTVGNANELAQLVLRNDYSYSNELSLLHSVDKMVDSYSKIYATSVG